MNPLTLSKQLLIAESELNRIHLIEDAAMIKVEVLTLANRTRSFTTIASSAITMLSGLLAMQRDRSATPSKTSWWTTLLTSSGMIASLWQAFQPVARPDRQRDG